MLTSNGLVLTSLPMTKGPQGEQLAEEQFNLHDLNVFWEGKVLGSYSREQLVKNPICTSR